MSLYIFSTFWSLKSMLLFLFRCLFIRFRDIWCSHFIRCSQEVYPGPAESCHSSCCLQWHDFCSSRYDYCITSNVKQKGFYWNSEYLMVPLSPTEQQKFCTTWQHLRSHKYTFTPFNESCFNSDLDIILYYSVTYLGKHNVKYKG